MAVKRPTVLSEQQLAESLDKSDLEQSLLDSNGD
jgi:hypothetical protein